MTVPKFVAGWVHQTRANKGYTNAQTDLSNQDGDPTCPWCGQESESFLHIVQCPALEGDRGGEEYTGFQRGP